MADQNKESGMTPEIAALSERVSKLEVWAHAPFDFTHLVERLERLERAKSLRQPSGGGKVELYRVIGRTYDDEWGPTRAVPVYERDTAAEAVLTAAAEFLPLARVAFLWSSGRPQDEEVEAYRTAFWKFHNALSSLDGDRR